MLNHLLHGDKVRYIGPTQRDVGLVQGATYVNFGQYPQLPMTGYPERDEIGVYVDDPTDNFGGVVSMPARLFEKVSG